MKAITNNELNVLALAVANNSSTIDEVLTKLSFYDDALNMQNARFLFAKQAGKGSRWGKSFLGLLEDRVGQCAKELKELNR